MSDPVLDSFSMNKQSDEEVNMIICWKCNHDYSEVEMCCPKCGSYQINNRPETGPIQFDGDWDGIFIRGDNALSFASYLEDLKSEDSVVMDLISLLKSCREPCTSTKLKSFVECLNEKV